MRTLKLFIPLLKYLCCTALWISFLIMLTYILP